MSHAADAQALLPHVHRKPKLQALLASLVDQFDEAQAQVDGVGAALMLDTATGWWLDLIGARVGAKRSCGLGDDAYRRKIRAIIAADRSNGSAAALLAMARSLFGSADGDIAYRGWQHLTSELAVTETVVDQETRNLVLNLAQRAVSGPTRVLLDTGDLGHGDEFALANAGWLGSTIGPGWHVVVVHGIGAHANAGTLTLSRGLAEEETVEYTKYQAENLFVFETANIHVTGASVEVESPGAGFGAGGLRRIQDGELTTSAVYLSAGGTVGGLSGTLTIFQETAYNLAISGTIGGLSGTLVAEVGDIALLGISGTVGGVAGTLVGSAPARLGFISLVGGLTGTLAATVTTPGPVTVDEGPITAASPTIVDEGPITAASPTIVDEGPITGM